MIVRLTVIFLAVVVTLVSPIPAMAAINCSISTVSVAFGSYNVFASSALTSTGSVTIRCVGVGTGTNAVSIALSKGNSASFQPRQMFRGIEPLSYNLYLDAGGTQIWGDGTGGTKQFASISNNQTVVLTIFGRIPPGQDVSIGSYTDTIIATINF